MESLEKALNVLLDDDAKYRALRGYTDSAKERQKEIVGEFKAYTKVKTIIESLLSEKDKDLGEFMTQVLNEVKSLEDEAVKESLELRKNVKKAEPIIKKLVDKDLKERELKRKLERAQERNQKLEEGLDSTQQQVNKNVEQAKKSAQEVYNKKMQELREMAIEARQNAENTVQRAKEQANKELLEAEEKYNKSTLNVLKAIERYERATGSLVSAKNPQPSKVAEDFKAKEVNVFDESRQLTLDLEEENCDQLTFNL